MAQAVQRLSALGRSALQLARQDAGLIPFEIRGVAGQWSGSPLQMSRHIWTSGLRASNKDAQQAPDAEPKPGPGPETSEAGPTGEGEAPSSLEELRASLEAAQKTMEEERKTGAEAKDRMLRTLADMENLRERTARQLADTKQFAVQGVVKSFIEVADNLERAISAVPMAELEAAEQVSAERAMTLLKQLRDGVVMTEGILLKLLEKEGVVRFDPLGTPFDPNLHNAMFEIPTDDHKPGHVAAVVKKGYMIHDRALRAADVGVARGSK